MDVYESIPEQIQVIGIWDGEDHGPVIDWLEYHDYRYRVQVEMPGRAQARAVRQVERGQAEVVKVEEHKVLAILGKFLHQHTTVEPGCLLVLRPDHEGNLFPTEMDTGYLASLYRKVNPAEQPPVI